ncbi:PAS domain-containing protein [Rhodovibrionaceae bacterium A322]
MNSSVEPVLVSADRDVLAARSQDIQHIYSYWNDKRQGRAMPRRADIDPLDMVSLLPNLVLVDVTWDPFKLTYRLVGTRNVEQRSFDPTGKSVEEGFFGQSKETVLALYKQVAEKGQPLFQREDHLSSAGRRMKDEVIFLPLSEDGQITSQILVCSVEQRA